jgi:hypothetical protein
MTGPDNRAVDTDDAATRLRLPPEADAWVRGLTGAAPPAPSLPAYADAPALLDRLRVRPDDAAEILAGWPSEDWPEELSWLLARVVARVRADLGNAGWLEPGPSLPRDRGPAWRHFYVYAYLALLADARDYHARHGVPDDVSWTTLADVGRNLAVDRWMNGEGWPVMLQWLTLHVRGAIYELGRLQFHRRRTPESRAISLHIPRSGPLTPQACDASFARAREFFPRHFPDEPYDEIVCTSWLLDPTLAEYLPADSNILRFQRRFELQPGGEDGVEDLRRFVFGTLTTPLDALTPRTALQRAGLAHLRAGGRFRNTTGRIPLDLGQ